MNTEEFNIKLLELKKGYDNSPKSLDLTFKQYYEIFYAREQVKQLIQDYYSKTRRTRQMKKINDTQDWAIHDKITQEHSKLGVMYKDKKQEIKAQQDKIKAIDLTIEAQEKLVNELCENRIKTYKDKDTKRLILDLTDDAINEMIEANNE